MPLRFDVTIRVTRLDEAAIDGDPLGLEQLLLNLLDNALAASPAGTEVQIALATGDEHATITVTDSGPGIPPSDLRRIFDRFYSKKLSTELGASAGLGLAIASALANDHGGELVARNEPAGGATFALTLPLTPPGRHHASADPAIGTGELAVRESEPAAGRR